MAIKKTTSKIWETAQSWEKNWHHNQQFNSFNEEVKQYIYASKMNLDPYKTNYFGIKGWDFGDKTIIDIGGSGQSILLKCKAKKRVVVDPILPSDWMLKRYNEAGIKFVHAKAEDYIAEEVFDISLIYNILQHVQNIKKTINNIKEYSKNIHVFEWIDQGISPGHIHDLKEEKLNKWLGGEGKVEYLNQNPCVGRVYYGIFLGGKK